MILGCLTIAVTPGDGDKQTIRAKAFIVVDDQGRECAKLQVDKDGPKLGLVDANGKATMVGP